MVSKIETQPHCIGQPIGGGNRNTYAVFISGFLSVKQVFVLLS